MDLDGYTDHLLVTHGLADSTVNEYRSYVLRWQRWAQTRGHDPARPTALTVRAWSTTLPTGVSSRDNAKASIMHLCCWQQLDDVSGAVGRPERNARNLRMPLTRTEARTLMAHAQQCGDQGTCVIIGLCTGMRISELSRFRWEDIDWRHRVIRYKRQKTSDRHTVPLAPQLAVRLADVRPDSDTGYVLASRTDGYRSTQGLRDWIKTVAAGCGLPWVQPHDLRRTFGRSVYELSGRDVTAAAKALGHSGTLDSTALYIRCDMDSVREALDGLHDYWGWDIGDDGMPAAA